MLCFIFKKAFRMLTMHSHAERGNEVSYNSIMNRYIQPIYGKNSASQWFNNKENKNKRTYPLQLFLASFSRSHAPAWERIMYKDRLSWKKLYGW